MLFINIEILLSYIIYQYHEIEVIISSKFYNNMKMKLTLISDNIYIIVNNIIYIIQ